MLVTHRTPPTRSIIDVRVPNRAGRNSSYQLPPDAKCRDARTAPSAVWSAFVDVGPVLTVAMNVWPWPVNHATAMYGCPGGAPL